MMVNYSRKRYRYRILLSFAVWVIFYYNLTTEKFFKFTHESSGENIKAKDTSVRTIEFSNSSSSSPLLFIAVLSHWKRWKRRDSIRKTWMTECRENSKVKCLFFTDYVGTGEKEKRLLQEEVSRHKDTIVMPVVDRLAFAARLLWILQWVSSHHRFHYFLRIDDDHFLCLERLLFELPFRPKVSLYWGFVHCQPSIVRVDEAWLMLTKDLIDEIIGKANTTLPCHPYGDQAVALWINNSTYNVTYFMDNKRIVHKTAGYDPTFYKRNVCKEYLSLHGVFHDEMRKFWLLWHKLHRETAGSAPKYNITEIQPFEMLCPHSKVFSTKGFYPEYRYKPQPCRLNPTWSISHGEHVAREESGERYSKY